MALESLEQVVQSSQSPLASDLVAHAHALRVLSKKQTGNFILASLLPVIEVAEGDQLPEANDPLDLVDPAECTLVVLYILSARAQVDSPTPVSIQHLSNFCTTFDPVHARYAPERVTLLAKGIYAIAERGHMIQDAIPLLMTLVRRYPPHLGYLTTIHPWLLAACVQTRHFTTAVPILTEGITEIDLQISDVQYTDNLLYHYLGGCVFAGLKRFKDAEEFFELTVAAPATAPSAIQIEAYKKLTLIQLILYGEPRNPPRYVSGIVTRAYKSQTAYLNLVKSYGIVNPNEIPAADIEAFSKDHNVGLLRQALDRTPFWAVHKLTKTYVSLSLTEIGQAIKIPDENAVRSLIQTMISTGEIYATVSPSGIVKFEDAPIPVMTGAEGERVLGMARAQCLKLAELDKQIAKSRAYLTAAIRERDHGGADYGAPGFPGDENDYPGALGLKIRGIGTWDEEMA